MQFLIECKDKSFCVIYQRSIVVQNVNKSLGIGESVTFLWPEDTAKAKEYTRIIIAKDRKFTYCNLNLKSINVKFYLSKNK